MLVVTYVLLMCCVEKLLSVLVHNIPNLRMIWLSTFGIGLGIDASIDDGRILVYICVSFLFFPVPFNTNMLSYMFIFYFRTPCYDMVIFVGATTGMHTISIIFPLLTLNFAATFLLFSLSSPT